jgi:hypothetical protein
MFAHMHEYFQDVADFIVPSFINCQSLGNSRICISGYEFVFTSHTTLVIVGELLFTLSSI